MSIAHVSAKPHSFSAFNPLPNPDLIGFTLLTHSNSLHLRGPSEMGFSLLAAAAAALWMMLAHRFPPGIASSALVKTADGITAAGQRLGASSARVGERMSAPNRVLSKYSAIADTCSREITP